MDLDILAKNNTNICNNYYSSNIHKKISAKHEICILQSPNLTALATWILLKVTQSQ